MNKPVIGIIFHRKIRDNYEKTLCDFGGVPLYLGVHGEVKNTISLLDGLLLAGGGDPLPGLFGEAFQHESGIPDAARDLFEINFIKEAVKKEMPILGICRGMQMINIALGGSLFQDIQEGHRQKENPHKTHHEINISQDSNLYALLGKEKLAVNSFHHQSIKALGQGLKVAAKSEDHIIEAIEGNQIFGFQWHIEWLNWRFEEQRIFADFIGRAYDYQQKT